MTQKQEKKITVGILTPPIGTHSLVPLSNLINILLPQSQSLYLITGNEGYHSFKNDNRIHISGVNHTGKSNIFLRIITFFLMQIRISIALLKVVKKCDIWIFFLGGENMILPMFVAKLFRKKVYLMFAGSSVHTLFYDDLVNWLKILTTINCTLSNKIILYSARLITEWNLNKWEYKIIIAQHSYIDFEKYSITTEYNNRSKIIGFVGRLSEEKGIWNFVFATELIIKKRDDIAFLIIGDGLLRQKIEDYINKNQLQSYVTIEGWISHDELPFYLNKLKLLVLPSYTEGLPNIMLEAMACGTPVLATPVGAIPDIIRNGETGFILANNSRECIAENIVRALNSPYLEMIGENCRNDIENNYTLDKKVDLWKKLTKDLL